MSQKPFIASNTGEPLVVLGHYPIAEDGGIIRETLKPRSGDHGCDPLGDGKFRMVPSGDIVDTEDMRKRLRRES